MVHEAGKDCEGCEHRFKSKMALEQHGAPKNKWNSQQVCHCRHEHPCDLLLRRPSLAHLSTMLAVGPREDRVTGLRSAFCVLRMRSCSCARVLVCVCVYVCMYTAER